MIFIASNTVLAVLNLAMVHFGDIPLISAVVAAALMFSIGYGAAKR